MTNEVQAAILQVSREDLREVIREERQAYVNETSFAMQTALKEVGLYAESAEARAEIREDLLHLRRWRKMFNSTSEQIGRSIVFVLTGALLIALWVGFKTHILKQP